MVLAVLRMLATFAILAGGSALAEAKGSSAIPDAAEGQTVRGTVESYNGDNPGNQSMGGVFAVIREQGTNRSLTFFQDDASCVLIRRCRHVDPCLKNPNCDHKEPRLIEHFCCDGELQKPPAIHQGDTIEITQTKSYWTGRREWSVNIVAPAANLSASVSDSTSKLVPAAPNPSQPTPVGPLQLKAR